MTDFLAGLGTEKLDGKPHYLEGLCRDFLAPLGFHCEVSWRDGRTSPRQLKALINTTQVFVMGVDADKHWITVVDVVGETVYGACSAVVLGGGRDYLEKSSPGLERVYNKQCTLAEWEVEEIYGLLISMSPSV